MQPLADVLNRGCLSLRSWVRVRHVTLVPGHNLGLAAASYVTCDSLERTRVAMCRVEVLVMSSAFSKPLLHHDPTLQHSCVLDGVRLRLQVAFACKLAYQAAEVHSGNAVVSNLCPESILVHADWDVRFCTDSITPVGQAVLRDEDCTGKLAQFQAPEACLTGACSTLSMGVWNVATVLLTAWSGRTPYGDCTEQCVWHKHVTGQAPSLALPEHPLPDAVRNILQQCFAFDALQRPSIEQVHCCIRTFAATLKGAAQCKWQR